ncbi:MAG TPA: DMT family transporter [Candidatus Dormibacteraeota bacterium]|nr:DMT family transporter [Candidatus Dormibacteraeota bacterium]
MPVALLGLLASLGWGVADFGGGLTSRRGPVLGVLLWSQVASLAIGLPIALSRTEPVMQPLDLAICVAGGALGSAGLALLYRGLSVGRMGVVAPVAAVLTAVLPVTFGFLTEGIPSFLSIGGIGCAVVSVILVSRAPAAGDGRPSGLWYGIGAGTVFGVFTIAVSLLGDGLILSPIIVLRIASCIAIGTWILARREPWRVARRLWPALVVVGVIDMSATVAYLTAIDIGPLAIAAILASLYPVVTTILAAVVLRERVSAIHAIGIVAAGAAVALIAGASAA